MGSLFFTLFVASTIPVLKVVLLCSVGGVAAKKGLLTFEGRKALSSMAYYVFAPALNFTKLASSLSPDRLVHWWPLIANMIISVLVGLALGFAQLPLLRPPRWFRPHVVIATALGNVGNLPLVIVSSLASSSAGILHGIEPDQASSLAISYVVVGLLVAVTTHATLGFNMLKPTAAGQAEGASQQQEQEQGQQQQQEQQQEQDTVPLLAAAPAAAKGAAAADGPSSGSIGQAEKSAAPPLPLRQQQHAPGGAGDSASAAGAAGDHVALHMEASASARSGDVEMLAIGPGSGPAAAAAAATEPAAVVSEQVAEAVGDPLPSQEAAGDVAATAQQRAPVNVVRRLSWSSGSDDDRGGGMHRVSSRLDETGWDREGRSNGDQRYYSGASERQPWDAEGSEGPHTDGQHHHHHHSQRHPSRPGHHHPTKPHLPIHNSRHPHHHHHDGGGWHGHGPQADAADSPGPHARLLSTSHSFSHSPLVRSVSHRLHRFGRSSRDLMRSWSHRGVDIGRVVVRESLSPPIIACLVSIPVGCISPVQSALFGPNAPLALFTGVLNMLADCCIPAMMIVLGATLAYGPGAGKVPLRTIASIGLARLVVLPLLGIALVIGSYKAGLFHAPDPIFLLVLLIQNTAPTAINVHTMASVHQNGDKEVSAVLFYQYLASIVTIPPYLSLYLYAVGRVFDSQK